MLGPHKDALQQELQGFRNDGLFKSERVITTPQHVRVDVGETTLVNFCANNYLGLAQHPEVIQAAHEGLDRWGVSAEVRDRLLGVIEQRCLLGTNGAEWFVSRVRARAGEDRWDALRATLLEYRERMHSNEPVHAWD